MVRHDQMAVLADTQTIWRDGDTFLCQLPHLFQEDARIKDNPVADKAFLIFVQNS